MAQTGAINNSSVHIKKIKTNEGAALKNNFTGLSSFLSLAFRNSCNLSSLFSSFSGIRGCRLCELMVIN